MWLDICACLANQSPQEIARLAAEKKAAEDAVAAAQDAAATTQASGDADALAAAQQALADAEANAKAAADALAAAVTKQEEDQEVLQNLLFAKDIDGKRPRDW